MTTVPVMKSYHYHAKRICSNAAVLFMVVMLLETTNGFVRTASSSRRCTQNIQQTRNQPLSTTSQIFSSSYLDSLSNNSGSSNNSNKNSLAKRRKPYIQSLNGNGSSPQRTAYDFLAESDKYLQFPSQRIGHDRLQPAVRPTKTTAYWKTNNLQSQTVQEEKPNSMFRQINQSSYMDTKTNSEYDESKETQRRLQYDATYYSSPFRFMGQPDTNGNIIPKKPKEMTVNDFNKQETDNGERLFYRSE